MLAFVIILGFLVIIQSVFILMLMQQVRELKEMPLDNRARDDKGRYVKNNPDTPENEAYKRGK